MNVYILCMEEDNNHIIKDEDLKAIYKLMGSDKDLIKLDKKKHKALTKIAPLLDNYNGKLKEAIIKFATEKDDKFFNKLILNGGYITVQSNIIKIPGMSGTIRKSPLEYINRYNINNAKGFYDDFSFSREGIGPNYWLGYWTDVEQWANFLSKSHMEKKMKKKYEPYRDADDKWVKRSIDIAKKYFKQNMDKYRDQYVSSLLEEFESIIAEKERKIYYSDSDPRVLFRLFKNKHKRSKITTKIAGGRRNSKRINKMLLSEFIAINKRGYQAILNSDGEVVPFIDGKEIKNSLINGTYEEYKEKLLDNAEHFDDYKEIYFKKHATTEDETADDEEDEDTVIDEDNEELNDEKSDGPDLK